MVKWPVSRCKGPGFDYGGTSLTTFFIDASRFLCDRRICVGLKALLLNCTERTELALCAVVMTKIEEAAFEWPSWRLHATMPNLIFGNVNFEGQRFLLSQNVDWRVKTTCEYVKVLSYMKMDR